METIAVPSEAPVVATITTHTTITGTKVEQAWDLEVTQGGDILHADVYKGIAAATRAALKFVPHRSEIQAKRTPIVRR